MPDVLMVVLPCRDRKPNHWRGFQAGDQHDSAVFEWHQPSDQQEPRAPRRLLLGSVVITGIGQDRTRDRRD